MGITSSTLSITFPTLTCFGSSISFISSYPKMSHQFGGQIGGVSLLKINSDPLIPGTNTIPCMVFPPSILFKFGGGRHLGVVVEIYAASVNAADYKVRLCAENPQSRGLFLRPIS